MLSIGVTVCDKDFKLLDSLLEQIEERVKVPHEVIIIDNREQMLNVETTWQPTFQFGYNAFQFNARAKIIELAKGDYIWFIDGDDEIGCINELDYDEDIIAFSYDSYPVGEIHIKPQIIKENVFSSETDILIRPVLWNKFIKRKLFKTDFPETKIVTDEDVLWFYSALKNAKSVRVVDEIIYYHKQGLSNKQGRVSIEELQQLFTGYKKMRKMMLGLIGEDFFKKAIKATNDHLLAFIPRCENIHDAIEFVSKNIPKKEVKESLTSIYLCVKNKKMYNKVVTALQNIYNKDFPYVQITRAVIYDDGTVKDYTFNQKLDFE